MIICQIRYSEVALSLLTQIAKVSEEHVSIFKDR